MWLQIFLCEYKEGWDKPTNRGLLKVIRQISSHENQEIQLSSEKVSDGNARILPLKPLVSECSQPNRRNLKILCIF